MRRRNQIKNAVANILEKDELARRDDNYLILRTVQEIEPIMASETFVNVMLNAKHKGISFASITRARRKYLNDHPELKDAETEQARREEEENYILEYGAR
jgi:hypothetical protein